MDLGFLRDSGRTAIVKRNVLGSFFVKGVSIAISLILVPLTIGYVNSELYGIWLTLATVISWMSLFDLGFGHGLRNRIAENIAKNDWGKARQYVSTAYVYFAIVFLPVCVIAYYLCPLVDWSKLLNIEGGYQETLVSTMQILIVIFFLTAIINTQSSVLQALQLTALQSAFVTLGQVITLLSIIILKATTEPSLQFLALAVSGSPLIVFIAVTAWLFGVKCKGLRPSFKYVDKSLVKDVFGLGINFFFLQIAALVLYQTTNIIISNVSGPEFVTEYNVVYKYMSIPMMATTIITTPFWTAFTDAYTLKDFVWMKKARQKLLLVFWGAMAVLLFMICVYPLFFRLWLGDKVDIHIEMVLICAIYVAILMWNNLHSTLLNGMGLVRVQLICSILGTVLCIPMSLFFGKMFGAIGVVATVAILSTPGVLTMYIQVNKILNNTARGIWCK